MRPIDGTKVKEYFTCARLPYLAFHRSREDELPATPRSQVYFNVGQRVEKELLAQIPHETVAFPRGDFEKGFHATLDLMAQGANAIVNGVLRLGEFLGRPDLLVRNESTGGYEVADIKSTMKVKTSARMQVAFYSRLLAQIALPPEYGHVILRDGRREAFALADLEASLARVLTRLLEMRRSANSDPGAHWREHCLECRFREICEVDLAAAAALEALPGITRAQAEALRQIGIDSPTALAQASPEIGKGSNLSVDQVRLLSARALAAIEGRPMRLRPPRAEVGEATFALAAIYSERLRVPHVAVAGLVFGEPTRFKMRMLQSDSDGANLKELLVNLGRSEKPIAVFGDGVFYALSSAVEASKIRYDVSQLKARAVDLRTELRRTFAMPNFDGTPAAAARGFGFDVGDDGVDIAALAHVEGEPGSDPVALESFLRRELLAIECLRGAMLGTEAP